MLLFSDMAPGQLIVFILGTVFTRFQSHQNRRSTLTEAGSSDCRGCYEKAIARS